MVDFNKQLKDRMNTAIPQGVDMTPKPRQAPAPKKKEEIPLIQEIFEAAECRSITRMVILAAEWKAQESQAKAARKPLTEGIKKLIQDNVVFMVGDIKVNRFTTLRSSIKAERLLSHGISPKIIAACTETTEAVTLKIVLPDEKDDYGSDG